MWWQTQYINSSLSLIFPHHPSFDKGQAKLPSEIRICGHMPYELRYLWHPAKMWIQNWAAVYIWYICEVTRRMENQSWHDKTFHEEATWVPSPRLGCLPAPAPRPGPSPPPGGPPIFPSSNIRTSAQHTNFKPHLKPKVTRSRHRKIQFMKNRNTIYRINEIQVTEATYQRLPVVIIEETLT